MNFTRLLMRKLLFVFFWYLLYYNLWFLFLIPEIYLEKNVSNQIALFFIYFFAFADSFARPFREREEYDKYSILIIIGFITNPIWYIIAFLENELIISIHISNWNNPIIFLLGIAICVIGGCILLTGRITLGFYGSGMIKIEKNHVLVTKGVFKYIRHPIYTGGIILGFGSLVAFRSLITPILFIIYCFLIFGPRINREEKLMEETFGEKFLEYKKKTKRMIPFIY